MIYLLLILLLSIHNMCTTFSICFKVQIPIKNKRKMLPLTTTSCLTCFSARFCVHTFLCVDDDWHVQASFHDYLHKVTVIVKFSPTHIDQTSAHRSCASLKSSQSIPQASLSSSSSSDSDSSPSWSSSSDSDSSVSLSISLLLSLQDTSLSFKATSISDYSGSSSPLSLLSSSLSLKFILSLSQ